MAKLTRVPAKVFAASAAADEIGQFGSAVAGAKLETADVAVIQGLSAWLDGWSEALVSGNRYPALQEMNGLLKVLSYQGAYALQEGIPEYDSATTYYIGSIVKKTGTFELYGSLTDDNVGNALTVGASWKLLADLNIVGYNASTANMPTLANNVSDANNDIDFGAGFCYDLTTNIKITNTALIKRLDATWAAGTNQGGLDTGSKAISTWYHCFAISKSDGTADFLFSTSPTTPTMPTDYVNKRRIGSIKTDGSGNILGFYQKESKFIWNVPIVDVDAAGTTSASLRTLTVPLGISVFALPFITQTSSSGVGDVYGLITSPLISDTTPTSTIYNISSYNNGSIFYNTYTDKLVLTNTSSQIRTRQISTSCNIRILTQGWVDLRGVN